MKRFVLLVSRSLLLPLLPALTGGALLMPSVLQAQLSATGGPSLRTEQLVPAAMGTRSDDLGNDWNIEQNGNLGRVGNASSLNSGLQLFVNGQSFYTYQPQMTADGKEFVLYHRQTSATQGLQIVRRIRLVEDRGVLRYLEVITNTTPNQLSASVELRNQFSSNFKAYYTDQGNPSVIKFGPRESGLLVTPGSNASDRAVLFSLCSPKSTVKPTISSRNRYALNFQYNITFAPGETVVIAHAVSQLPVPRKFDRKTLSSLFRPLALERLQASIPRELRRHLGNYRTPSVFGGVDVLPETALAGLGVERGRRDIVALGEETRLLGSAVCRELMIQSDFGEAIVPFEEVVAIQGGDRGRRDRARVFLRDGQAYGGELRAEGLRFLMASGGKMNLDASRLDRLVRAEGEEEGIWDAEVGALIETFSGDRIALLESDQVSLRGVTPWGPLEFTLDEIYWMGPQEDEPVGHFVEFKRGSRCFAFLSGETLSVRSPLFGEHQLAVHDIRAIVTRAGRDLQRKAREQGEAVEEFATAVMEPHLVLRGGQRVVGAVETKALSVLAHAEPIQLRPAEVRKLMRLDPDDPGAPGRGPLFQLQLWGGGVMSGHLGQPDLLVRVRGALWAVPVADVVSLATPVPRLNEEARQDIARLIRQLGDEDWGIRERATEELAGFGYLASSILEEELRSNRDAEVRRRIEQILASMD